MDQTNSGITQSQLKISRARLFKYSKMVSSLQIQAKIRQSIIRKRYNRIFYSKSSKIKKKLISYIQFNTDNALFNELFYDKNAINLVIMNKALNSVDFLKLNPKFKPYKNGIMRITRNPATTAADLISSLDNSDFTVDEYFGCADNHRNFHNFDNIKPCSGECPQFQLGGAGYNSTSTSGNVLTRSGNSPKIIYKLGNEHLNRQNNDSRM